METTLPFTNEIPLFMRLGKIAAYSNLKSMGTMTLEQIAEATQLSIAEISKL